MSASASRRRMWAIHASWWSAFSPSSRGGGSPPPASCGPRPPGPSGAAPWPGRGGGSAQRLGGVAGHHRDGVVEPALAIARQPLGEPVVGVDELTSPAADRHGALGERDGLPQFVRRRRQQQAGPARPLGDVRVRGRAELRQQVAAGAAVLRFVPQEQAQLGVTEPVVVRGRTSRQLLLPVGKQPRRRAPVSAARARRSRFHSARFSGNSRAASRNSSAASSKRPLRSRLTAR